MPCASWLVSLTPSPHGDPSGLSGIVVFGSPVRTALWSVEPCCRNPGALESLLIGKWGPSPPARATKFQRCDKLAYAYGSRL
jgi:hypothetical protein